MAEQRTTPDSDPAADPVADALAQILQRLESMDRRLASVEADQANLQPIAPPLARHDRTAEPTEPAAGREQVEAGADVGEQGAGLSRRRMITGVTALGAAGVALFARAEPVAAANGDPVIAGASNTATAATIVTANLPGTGAVIAINPAAGTAAGLYAQAGSSANIGGSGAVIGDSNAQPGVSGLSASSFGVVGKTTTGLYGVAGTSSGQGSGAAGVHGIHTSNGRGVHGTTGSGVGVLGDSSTGTGVFGTTATGDYGILGRHAKVSSSESAAVAGRHSGNGFGVEAYSFKGTAVRADGFEGLGVDVSSPLAHLRLRSNPGRVAPTADAAAHVRGDVVVDGAGILWFCTANGTPGTWRRVSGPATAGQFHVLPTPVRVYDSRSGTSPSQGPKTKLTGNVARPIDCTLNSSGVPKGATAVSLTVLLVNAANTNGNLTIWANGAARPASNTAVWGAGSGRYTTTAICALDANARIQVSASASTDLVLDVVGYYR
jgi:hypothetical protein